MKSVIAVIAVLFWVGAAEAQTTGTPGSIPCVWTCTQAGCTCNPTGAPVPVAPPTSIYPPAYTPPPVDPYLLQYQLQQQQLQQQREELWRQQQQLTHPH